MSKHSIILKNGLSKVEARRVYTPATALFSQEVNASPFSAYALRQR